MEELANRSQCPLWCVVRARRFFVPLTGSASVVGLWLSRRQGHLERLHPPVPQAVLACPPQGEAEQGDPAGFALQQPAAFSWHVLFSQALAHAWPSWQQVPATLQQDSLPSRGQAAHFASAATFVSVFGLPAYPATSKVPAASTAITRTATIGLSVSFDFTIVPLITYLADGVSLDNCHNPFNLPLSTSTHCPRFASNRTFCRNAATRARCAPHRSTGPACKDQTHTSGPGGGQNI